MEKDKSHREEYEGDKKGDSSKINTMMRKVNSRRPATRSMNNMKMRGTKQGKKETKTRGKMSHREE